MFKFERTSLRTDFADSESLDEFSVLHDVACSHVGFQAAAAANQEQQASAAVEILLVDSEVIGDLRDSRLHHGNLNFGGTGIARLEGIGFDRFFFEIWI